MTHRFDVTIVSVVQNTHDVVTLHFLAGGKPLTHQAGQYITVYFDDTDVREGKAYSISATPWDDELAITVKNVDGPFSRRLCALQPGDHLAISSPFGFFNAHDDAAPLVAIAAGVGVSPIRSIIRDECKKNPQRDITLYFTAPREDELVFRHEIDDLFKAHPHAQAQYFVTRQPESAVGQKRRFAVATDIPEKSLREARFYLCGAETFVRDIFRSLMEAGVDETRVVTETFFESGA